MNGNNIIFLNGDFMPEREARISPMDRGFLFGEGIYEVIPSYEQRLLGHELHIQRLNDGLAALRIKLPFSTQEWRTLFEQLLLSNQDQGQSLGVYVHVSRGSAERRYHGFISDTAPTVFIRTFAINDDLAAGAEPKVAKVMSSLDKRWARCHVKSTSLLGNVLHFQDSLDAGYDETLLFNEKNELTEASSCNVFMVKGDEIATPPLDHQILPGITRALLIGVLQEYMGMTVSERVISMDEVQQADELWLTSSTREVMPIVALDGAPVGTGDVGAIWRKMQPTYAQSKFTIG